MKVKKSLLFVVSSVVTITALVVVGLLAFRAAAKMRAAEQDLQRRTGELVGFYGKNPFPSMDNVRREKENIAEIEKWFGELMGLARKGQISLVRPSPSKFMEVLSAKSARLAAAAKRQEVALPANFTFGFDRYLAPGGGLPSPSHVPRLMQQLAVVENLCEILYDERVTAVSAVEREVFEGASVQGKRKKPVSAEIKNAGLVGEDDLFAKLHFTVDFTSREKALLGILNRLASHEMFVVVTNVKFQKLEDDIMPARARAADGGAEADEGDDDGKLSRQERTISGVPVEAPMKIRLELDVYRFREDEA
jgi:hypothetical protein